MEGYRRVLRSLMVALVTLSGSGCAWLRSPPRYALPTALPPSPPLEQVIGIVNNNSSRIHSFSTDEARLSVPGIPSLSAAIAFERVVPGSLRPVRLRLRAGTGVFGPELDLGSNDELFWIWVTRQPPLYYCRHDQFAASPVRHRLPIDPQWLIEAAGLAEFDPALPHQGPYVRPGGRLEIRTVRETADGAETKITVVDARTGAVVEQHVYDPQRRLVASALASHHRRDPLTGAIMPRIVQIHCPRAQFSARLDLGNVRINRPVGNPMELWTMPTVDPRRMVDLGDPNLQIAPDDSPATPMATLLPRLWPPRRAANRMRH